MDFKQLHEQFGGYMASCKLNDKRPTPTYGSAPCARCGMSGDTYNMGYGVVQVKCPRCGYQPIGKANVPEITRPY